MQKVGFTLLMKGASERASPDEQQTTVQHPRWRTRLRNARILLANQFFKIYFEQPGISQYYFPSTLQRNILTVDKVDSDWTLAELQEKLQEAYLIIASRREELNKRRIK